MSSVLALQEAPAWEPLAQTAPGLPWARRARNRSGVALALSVIAHGLLLTLSLGGGDAGWPSLRLPWEARRATELAPRLNVELRRPAPPALPPARPPASPLTPAAIAHAEPAPPLRSEPALQLAETAPTPVTAPAATRTPRQALRTQWQPAAAAVPPAVEPSASAPPIPQPAASAPPILQPAVSAPPILQPAVSAPPNPQPAASAPPVSAPTSAPAPVAPTSEEETASAPRLLAAAPSRVRRERSEALRAPELSTPTRVLAPVAGDPLRQRAAQLDAAQDEAERRAAAQALAEAQAAQAARDAEARAEALRAETARREALQAEAARLEAVRQAAARAEAARLQAEQAARAEQAAAARAQAEAQAATQAATQAAAQTAAQARAQEQAAEDARREARKREIGRQLDEERAQREAADKARADAARSPAALPSSWSPLRRARLWGHSDPNALIVSYADAWARRIQLNTAIDWVREAATRTHAAPVFSVALRSDGTVENVTLVSSSGVPEVDALVRRIVERQAPYPPFPPALARELDVLEIRRSWHFRDVLSLH